MTTSKQKNTMNCFQAVYGDDGKNRYSIVADLRELLEAEGIQTRGEETNCNMEILVAKKDVRKAVDLICKECDQKCGVTPRYRPVIYYKHREAKRWMKWYRIEYTYASKSLARTRARVEILDFKKTDPDSYKQLQFKIKIEENYPRGADDEVKAASGE